MHGLFIYEELVSFEVYAKDFAYKYLHP